MSSSTFVADSTEDKDDQLIILVNADGTITVDSETLSKLIANQHHGNNLSIVRVGDGNVTPDDGQDDGEEGPHVNLTVEGYYSGNEAEILPPDAVDASSEVVDPFSQMEPEHIARLESVLQSEQAKEILGTNLDDNLNSMLDMLEGKDEVPRSAVHNDHSYTTSLPAYQQPQPPPQQQPVQPQTPPTIQHRPLTRGGRGRGRGRGLMTRGGSRGAAQQQVIAVTSSPVIIQQSPTPKVIQASPQKTFIVTQTPRVITQPAILQPVVAQPIVPQPVVVEEVIEQHPPTTPTLSLESTPRIIQRKLIVPKPQPQPQLKQQTLQQVLLSSPQVAPTGSAQETGRPASVVRASSQPIIIQKKLVPVRGSGRGRGGRVGRGGRGRHQQQAPSVSTSTVSSTGGDEVSAALQAMELSPPSSLPVASPPQPTLPVTSPPKVQASEVPEQASPGARRKNPTVIIRKIGSRSEIVSSPSGKASKVRHHEDSEQVPSPVIQQTPVVKAVKQVTLPKPTEAIPSPRGPTKDVVPAPTPEETSLKKKKEKKASVPPVIVEGPELFSTPDIIRRVSTDKQSEIPTTPQTPPAQVEPKVQVQPTHPPFTPTNSDPEMTAERLLDSIHEEAAKDGSTLLAEALLLDDLTNDDSTSMSYPGKEKSEPERIVLTESPNQQIQPKPSPPKPTEAPAPRIRKLPPIELPTTRSASKKAAASTNQPVTTAVVQQQQTQVQSPVSTKTGGQKERKQLPVGAAIEKKQPNESRKISEKKYSLKEDFVSDFEEEGESDDESWNSEDDPDRLWCICKKPHNNRFMICCDGCEEWFHGKCVGVTKAMGEQMEKDGTEWSCPNCRNKTESVNAKAQLATQETTKHAVTAPTKLPAGQQTISSLECITCKKPARVGSNYCSDVCVRRHALTMIGALKEEVDGLQPNTRVIVYEKKTGRIIADSNAPTVSNLADWLLENPTFEVHKPSISGKGYKKNVIQEIQSPSNNQVNRHTKTAQSEVKQPNVQLKQQLLPQAKQVQQLPKHQAPASKQLPPSQGKQAQQGTPTKQVQQSTKSQPHLAKAQPSVKQAGGEKSTLKQTLLTPKVTGNGTKEINYLSRTPTTPKIQIIQAQPITPTQPKLKIKEIKKEEDEESKNKKNIKPVTGQVQQERSKRSSVDGKKLIPEKPSPSPKEEKKRESTSNKETVEKEDKKKKDDKRKEKRKDSVESSKPSEETGPTNTPVHSGEPIRANVKRTIQELLNQRVKQDESISITNDEVKELAVSIEEEMFALFKDTGTKYKAKYRSLVFNIKDPKNLTLYKKIVEKSISPDQLVRLSPEELASQELAQWREKEAKHQLEIIKKNELDLIHQAKTVVLKSRKGEEVIESKVVNISEIESALNRTAEDYEVENIVSSATKDEEKLLEKLLLDKKFEKESDERPSRSTESKKKSKDERKRDRSRSHSRKRSRSKSRDSDKRKKDKDKEKDKGKDKERDKAEETLKEIEEVISQHVPTLSQTIDSDQSDREPSSTVNISTPPLEEEKPPVWQGYLNMTEVTKLYTSAYEVSGSCEDLGEELSDQLDCVGRIQPDSVWEYVSRMKKAGTKDIIVIRFQSEAMEEKMNYLSLYSYLNSRNRMAVIGQTSKTVKDFYVLPLASHSPIPQVLLPLDGPGFDDYRTHLLLGIIIRTKKGIAPNPGMALSNRNRKPAIVSSTTNNLLERSYTPPLPDSGFADSSYPDSELPDSGSTTPPLPSFKSFSHTSGLTPPLPDEDEPYSPGEPYSPEDSQTEAILVNPDIQRNLEEVNRMIEQKRQQIKNIAQAAASGSVSVDEETPYSPSSSFTPPQDNIPFLDTDDIKLPPNLQDILASIKGTPTMDVKSDPIVKAYTSQSMYYDDEDDVRDDDKDSRNERTSRDPRQRPEPKPKSALSQFTDSDLIRKAAEMESGDKKEPFKPTYYFPPPPPPLPVGPPPVPVGPPPPIYGPPPPGHYKYPPAPPPSVSIPPPPIVPKDRKRKDKFKERRPPPMPHPQRRKWDNANHHRGGMMGPHRPPMRGRQPRFRGGFERGRGGGGFRGRGGGGFRPHRGGPPPRFDRGHNRERNVQSEWDEEIRNFEQRKARERKRKASRSPSPRRRSVSPPRRRSRRASSNSS